MKAQFSDTQFQAAHGRKPRGTGNWWFRFSGNGRSEQNWQGTFCEAKKQAMAFAKKNGFDRVEVGS